MSWFRPAFIAMSQQIELHMQTSSCYESYVGRDLPITDEKKPTYR